MIVVINGETTELELETLAEIVAHFKLDPNLVVTEVDNLIIEVEERSATKLYEGMKIEIVQFVGGG
ncbi:sulfur carrier protein ThiS [Anaerobacillus isosaccharinicus]|uniref:Sulfur carrier protein ThiS n=1 Tax=Anaerobacillus isosaccharinicus TaxID=1532552 RepID=A0A1S2M218_9BACI|nr:sulfur carrier protein ThiS [Anaerobacillus isosaccharinicus]MBA5585568.1 sulfur carrier protein ThiS [Anaerobacillus isosaccharinicus]QOY36119.1 sulfur carrier protein ThiS [Anaerobacillus isosaccharinicus]